MPRMPTYKCPLGPLATQGHAAAGLLSLAERGAQTPLAAYGQVLRARALTQEIVGHVSVMSRAGGDGRRGPPP